MRIVRGASGHHTPAAQRRQTCHMARCAVRVRLRARPTSLALWGHGCHQGCLQPPRLPAHLPARRPRPGLARCPHMGRGRRLMHACSACSWRLRCPQTLRPLRAVTQARRPRQRRRCPPSFRWRCIQPTGTQRCCSRTWGSSQNLRLRCSDIVSFLCIVSLLHCWQDKRLMRVRGKHSHVAMRCDAMGGDR